MINVTFIGGEPTRQTEGSAGFDLAANCDTTLLNMDFWSIQVGTRIKIPKGYYGQIVGRSGLAKKGLLVHNGTVDSDYTGYLRIIIFNLGCSYTIERGDRIAQLIIRPIVEVEYTEVNELPETKRGAKGFGSTGR